VNAREGVVDYNPVTQKETNKKIVGLIKPKDRLRVIGVQRVLNAESFVWIEFEIGEIRVPVPTPDPNAELRAVTPIATPTPIPRAIPVSRLAQLPPLQRDAYDFSDGTPGTIYMYQPEGSTQEDFRDLLIENKIYSTSITSLPSTQEQAGVVKSELQTRGIVVTRFELPERVTSYMANTPTVFYYADSTKPLAEELAEVFTQLTKLRFRATRGASATKGPTLRFMIHCVPTPAASDAP
jgi:hypothetical protein